MMRHILILGAGKSATVLIKTLLKEASQENWMVHVADGQISMAKQKINSNPYGKAYTLVLEDESTWHPLIQRANLVISMLPPPLHPLIAAICLYYGKHFLNASYLSEQMKGFHAEAEKKGLLFLNEMGLDPGIDHMSAMELMDKIKDQGGKILSFRSHCGGLISPESDDNPWHYKISWNPRNIITAGKDGARFLQNGKVVTMPYNDLFSSERIVEVPGDGKFAWYPNRDSLSYQQLYHLDDVHELVRTTLRHPDFCEIWSLLVRQGFTNENELISTNSIRYADYFNKKLNNTLSLSSKSIDQLSFIGAFSEAKIGLGVVTPADILQHMLERSLALKDGDKDMIVMLHEITYVMGNEVKTIKTSLLVKGENELETAMAKTVGLPLAIAAKLVLNKQINLHGVQIPIYKEIYIPVLRELDKNGIHFKLTT